MLGRTLGIGSWLGQFMAGPTHPLKRHRRSGDGLRQTVVVLAIGASLAAGLFVAGNYIVAGQYAPTGVQAFIKAATGPNGRAAAATANGDEIYTGSILYIPYDGASCRQLLFDNRNGRFTDNGSVDCVEASYQSGIGSPKQWSAARVKVISTGFRGQ
jgi:hypothetical protein